MALHNRRPQVLLMLGAPGAGKGTQASFLAEQLGIPHVASGDLLREHRQRGTELGRTAQAYMDRGDLVPDELVVDMVMQRLGEPDALGGALLDGFPRTVAQATALKARLAERGTSVQTALNLEVPKEKLIERIAGRRICGSCRASYHVRFNPSPVHPRCGRCGGELEQRADDRPDVVANRVDVYLRQTRPLIEHYARLGLLCQVDGDQPIAAVRHELLATVNAPRDAALVAAAPQRDATLVAV